MARDNEFELRHDELEQLWGQLEKMGERDVLSYKVGKMKRELKYHVSDYYEMVNKSQLNFGGKLSQNAGRVIFPDDEGYQNYMIWYKKFQQQTITVFLSLPFTEEDFKEPGLTGNMQEAMYLVTSKDVEDKKGKQKDKK